MNVITRRLIKTIQAVNHMILLVLGWVVGNTLKIFDKSYREVWLVSERGIDARDNGYVFFRFLRDKHPEVNSYYVIDANSVDYQKVAELGKTVQFRSFKHYVLLAISKYNVSTHVMGYTPDMVIFVWLDRLHVIRGKKIFLQHGIIKDDMLFNHYPHISLDIFNTSAKPEYEYIKDNYGHPEGVVKMLGMCRYDNLHDLDESLKNQILVMPTWRNDIVLNCKSDNDFISTDYYKAYQSLINNESINRLLEKYNCEMVFYPHLEMQKYLHLFSTQFKRVRISSFETDDVQKLLVESKLLITDYSSVFFDFAYMDKPEIYYQFDEKAYREGHYKEGYFTYRQDGFGPVIVTEDELVREIEKIVSNDFAISSDYQLRIDDFFTLRDTCNCERIFDAIYCL